MANNMAELRFAILRKHGFASTAILLLIVETMLVIDDA